jgi:hypothetical protein
MATPYQSEQRTSTTISKFLPREWSTLAAQSARAAERILATYLPTSLKEMKAVSLLRRVDTKYVMHSHQLFQALNKLSKKYRVLEVQGYRLNRYHNLYFDTPGFDLYHQHHKQQRDRYKVRCREYVDTQLNYLEVKRKNNRDQTIKSRLPSNDFISDLSQKEHDFLRENYPFSSQPLQPVLWNDFMRVTLVSNHSIERLTLDINLQFSNGWEQIGLPGLVIAEVKQDGFSIHSDFMQQMRAMKVQPQRFSKYCMGITLFYPQVKYNRFKRRTLLVERIMRQGAHHGYFN